MLVFRGVTLVDFEKTTWAPDDFHSQDSTLGFVEGDFLQFYGGKSTCLTIVWEEHVFVQSFPSIEQANTRMSSKKTTYTLVNSHNNGLSSFSIGNASSKGTFSIAMLVYGSVNPFVPNKKVEGENYFKWRTVLALMQKMKNTTLIFGWRAVCCVFGLPSWSFLLGHQKKGLKSIMWLMGGMFFGMYASKLGENNPIWGILF